MKYNLPVIILKGTVLLPNLEIKLEFEDEVSKCLIDEAEMFHDNKVLVITKTSLEENILINELPNIGTICSISKKLELPNGKIRIVLKGLARVQVLEYLSISKDVIESIVSTIKEDEIDEEIKTGLIRKLYTELDSIIKKVPYISNSVISLISDTEDLNKITDIIINNLPLDVNRKLEYLVELNTTKRVEMILEDIYKEQQLFNIESNIETKVKKELEDDQKNLYLKEKIKLLKEELGETSPKGNDVEKLKEKLENLNACEEVKEKILYEINRYDNMPNISPEISIVRNYIDIMLSLPWRYLTKDIDDLNLVKSNLDKTHYGLNDVKDRIIEYLAVKKQAKQMNAPIICLVGPPGVGKTTLAKSISKSMGRNFVKISLGGIDDEAFIKGHIRTYLGSTPGKIIDGLKRAKSSNPVFLIDEIDKMSNTYKGDPKSALLEVLDPIQNKHFKDNYIEEEYDLSNVLFITTANDVSLIPKALKDRLEIININGYTELEKLDIAKKYIIPSVCEKHGINNIKMTDEQIMDIIKYYTKESGLRELERMICKIVRKIITKKSLTNKRAVSTIKNISEYLGNKIYEKDKIKNEVGIVNGLVYTEYGGDVIPIEVNNYKGNGQIILTGSLGNVMMESAKIALSYIKANSKLFKINYDLFKDDIHINIPNISEKKEGPSAGLSITTAIISALSNLKIGSNIAFTGEITLRGNILKIGGLKEKVIGAYLNNIDTIFIPKSNVNDLDSIPEEVKNRIKFILVNRYEEVYEYIKENSHE